MFSSSDANMDLNVISTNTVDARIEYISPSILYPE